MKRLLVGVAMLSVLTGPTMADWSEDFEVYNVGDSLHGQGGWEGWGNDPTWTAYVSDAHAQSGSKSVAISGSSDLVHQYAGYTSDHWTYTAHQLIPQGFTGNSYFILLNSYSTGYNWSTQVRFDSGSGVVASEFEGAWLPLIIGRWVEIRVEIDLAADTQSFYYDGQLLTAKSWTNGVSGGGALNIGAVDLFANGSSAIYYDDLSLTPEPASVGLLALGVIVTLRRR